jgi:O-antigen/teichoic acid export membrane protein
MEQSAQAQPGPAHVLHEVQLAIWNALKLGSSLILTWSVSLAVRALLPRYLGPEQFGAYSFADAVATTFFVFCTLGVETYVQKQVPVRPEHASEFFGGILTVRLLMSAALLALMCLGLTLTGRRAEVVLVSALFGVGQIFFVHNATFVSMLNARGKVDGMSVVNVAAKTSWAACIFAAVWLKLGLWALAASFIVGEALRSAVLFNLCRRHLSLRIAFDRQHLRAALIRSAPFFVATLSFTLYSRFDVMMLSYLASPIELGWYAASSQVSNLGLLMVPLISGVCLPMFSRARHRSEEELGICIRRALEIILMVAIPLSLAVFVGADVWIGILGGPRFEPAARSLRSVAPIFVLTYVAILCSSFLNLINRAWTVTRVCILGIFANASLNVVLIRHLGPRLGVGGAGMGAALSAVVTEAFVCALLLSVIGKRVIDARLARVLLRTALVCAAVVAADALMRPVGPGRLLVDGALYVGLALLSGAVRMDELRQAARSFARPRAG